MGDSWGRGGRQEGIVGLWGGGWFSVCSGLVWGQLGVSLEEWVCRLRLGGPLGGLLVGLLVWFH